MQQEWLTGLAGGVLIGISATLMLALSGRIAGISGIFAGFLRISASGFERLWRGLFVAGLIAGAGLFHLLSGQPFPAASAAAPAVIVIAGLLVGYGTRLGCGCTSGHGVCGIGRLSVRSLVATLVFMAAGFVMVFLMRHVFAGGLQ